MEKASILDLPYMSTPSLVKIFSSLEFRFVQNKNTNNAIIMNIERFS